MGNRHYALVAYVRNPVGEFVESLRRELHPELPHLAAHLTILPPRPLKGSERAALELLEDLCGQVSPFAVSLGDVEKFVPVTPTVFIRVARAAYRMRELHDRLNSGPLEFEEQWPYMPHLTIAKMGTTAQAEAAYEMAHERWKHFDLSRTVAVEQLTFVREAETEGWVDLAPVLLGQGHRVVG